MDKETGQGSSRDAQDAETIALDLDQVTASSLYLILKHFVETSDVRLRLHDLNQNLSDEARKNMRDLELSLKEDAEKLIVEIGQIINELDDPAPRIKIITKPTW